MEQRRYDRRGERPDEGRLDKIIAEIERPDPSDAIADKLGYLA